MLFLKYIEEKMCFLLLVEDVEKGVGNRKLREGEAGCNFNLNYLRERLLPYSFMEYHKWNEFHEIPSWNTMGHCFIQVLSFVIHVSMIISVGLSQSNQIFCLMHFSKKSVCKQFPGVFWTSHAFWMIIPMVISFSA